MKNPIGSGGFEDSSTAAINRSATFANETGEPMNGKLHTN